MLIWNGIDMSPYFTVNSIEGRGVYHRELRTIKVPGVDETYLEGVDLPPRPLTYGVTIKAKNLLELRSKIEEINRIMLTPEPVPLSHTDEPNKTYYGMLSGVQESLELEHLHQTEITVICLDPYKYGPISEEVLPSTINITGSADVTPVYELDVNHPITYVMINNDKDEQIILGSPSDGVDDPQPYEQYESIYKANGISLVGWTSHSYVDGGTVTGTLGSDGTKYRASSYGTGSNWHGPARRASLPETLGNFRLDTHFTLLNSLASHVGRVEVYLLDNLGNSVGKIALKDTHPARDNGIAEIRVGDDTDNHFIISGTKNPGVLWKNFTGLLRIEREDNMWRAQVSKLNSNGDVVQWVAGEYHDVEGRYSEGISQIVMHVAQSGSHPTPDMGINSIEVFKINKQPEGTPYIAREGDKIVIDVKSEEVTINGEHRDDLVSFITTFFRLRKGSNTVNLYPVDRVTGKAVFREMSL